MGDNPVDTAFRKLRNKAEKHDLLVVPTFTVYHTVGKVVDYTTPSEKEG